ncbi:YciI family protein [Streptomyces sp. enrichment culture]|uniref:YciI family protein n=1 Tax=Streptomyces sp. enrichment culture TaxID=1795815 RepID=UPI003F55135C
MSETPKKPWNELVQWSQEHGLLAKRLYVVTSTPANGLSPVLDNLEPHVAYQTELEVAGVMFAAGPLASPDLQEWLGEGLFVYRAASMEEATAFAENDPMHSSGARRFSVREWMLNEGSFSVQLFYSGGRPKIV